MEQFFPNGFASYLIGGVLVGLGVSIIFVITGVRAGASGVLTAIFGAFSERESFASLKDQRGWRVAFTVGLIGGALAVTLLTTDIVQSPTTLGPWRMAVGGLLVGFGTRMARGCTSGHGICGLSSLEGRSLVHVLTFMGVAMLVAHLVRGLS